MHIILADQIYYFLLRPYIGLHILGFRRKLIMMDYFPIAAVVPNSFYWVIHHSGVDLM
jgi:hypothetical protein